MKNLLLSFLEKKRDKKRQEVIRKRWEVVRLQQQLEKLQAQQANK